MNEYLKLFQSHAEYEAFVSGDTMETPNVSHCIDENEVHYNPIKTMADEYLTFIALEGGQFTFTPQNNNVISYSIDGGGTWTQGNSVSVNTDDKVLWKGTMTPDNGIGTFSATGNFDAQGNVMSLLFGDNYMGQTNLTGKTYAFKNLFQSNQKIISAKNLSLPATTLTQGCYYGMFYNCTSLTTAPELPTTTLAENCYGAMFDGCTSLTTAPSILPATTLAGSCYNGMFNSCTSLTVAPELPATTLANGCYGSMFNGCTSLTVAPELPATTLAIACYLEMFNGCSRLNSITCLATNISAAVCTNDWLNGVASSGTFTKAASMSSWTTGVNGIPTNWTVVDAS